MSTELDLVVIGAGCAGLSLGIELARLGNAAPKTVLLDHRTSYENDRTWCFWGDAQAPFAALASHQWPQISVQQQHKTILIDCALTPYRLLAANDFYHYARQTIGDNKRLTLKTGIHLLAPPSFDQGLWQLETSIGKLVTKAIVDTRPLPTAQLAGTRLWQSFLGYEVECADALFNPQLAQLMDFCPANTTGLHFNYVLPLSATRALIEFTTFAALPLSPAELEPGLNMALEKVLQGRRYTRLRTESGQIPMGLSTGPVASSHRVSDGSYRYAGLSAGAARPATGYAFARIQVWAKQCAQALLHKGMPVGHQPDAFPLRQMDALFLKVLRDHPALGPELFMALFSNVDSTRLIRFLSDRAGAADYFAVIKALPVAPFVKALTTRGAN